MDRGGGGGGGGGGGEVEAVWGGGGGGGGGGASLVARVCIANWLPALLLTVRIHEQFTATTQKNW